MINNAILTEIKNRLFNLEKEEEIQIFFTCESGSRAWGFPSSDSDYDVRFLYLRKPEWYLMIDEGRDVIEQEIVDDIDLSGWDLKKALKLFRKSNPPLLEWLDSPIIYFEKYSIAQNLRNLIPEYYSPLSSMYHYLHMAEGNVREYLKGEQVWIKKYFYVLRPLLACLWIERELGPAPTEFEKLVNTIVTDSSLKTIIQKLIEDKKEGKELSYGARIPEISNFIDEKIEYFKQGKFNLKKTHPDTEILNELFRNSLEEVWGSKY